MPLCDEAAATLRKAQPAAPAIDATAGEHSIEVLLPLLQSALGRFCLVPVLVGSLDERAERTLAERLAAILDERTLVVASADFVHYGKRYDFTPFGPLREAVERVKALDDRAIALVASRDAAGLRAFFRETGHNACGRHALLVLLELLELTAPESRATLIARYASSDLSFVRDESSVGYATLAFTREAGPQPSTPLGVPPPLATVDLASWKVSDELGERLRRLARAAIETELFGGAALDERPSGPRPGAGAATAPGRFRLALPQRTAGRPVAASGCAAVAASRRRSCRSISRWSRPRSTPRCGTSGSRSVRRDELRDLQVEVTLLSPLRSVDSPEAYRFGQDGLVLTKGEEGRALPAPGLEGSGLVARGGARRAGREGSPAEGRMARCYAPGLRGPGLRGGPRGRE